MAKKTCNITVTWLGSDTRCENCKIRTDYFNQKHWIVLERAYDHDFVIDVLSIRNLFQDTDNPKRLRINMQNKRLWAEFADSRQAASWLKEIKDLKESASPAAKKQELQVYRPKEVSSGSVTNDKVEIPYPLRPEVKFALFETAALGPIGAFSATADIASIAGFWGYLLVQYSKYYGIALDKDSAVKICSTALLGMGGYYLGCKTATKLFHLIPAAGPFAAMGISALQNIIFTYRFAITLTRIFRQGSVNYETLGESIKYMFAGTATGFLNIMDIWHLCVDD